MKGGKPLAPTTLSLKPRCQRVLLQELWSQPTLYPPPVNAPLPEDPVALSPAFAHAAFPPWNVLLSLSLPGTVCLTNSPAVLCYIFPLRNLCQQPGSGMNALLKFPGTPIYQPLVIPALLTFPRKWSRSSSVSLSSL